MGNLLCGTGTKEEREQAKINKWWSITDINEQHNEGRGTEKHQGKQHKAIVVSTNKVKKKSRKQHNETIDTMKQQETKTDVQQMATMGKNKGISKNDIRAEKEDGEQPIKNTANKADDVDGKKIPRTSVTVFNGFPTLMKGVDLMKIAANREEEKQIVEAIILYEQAVVYFQCGNKYELYSDTAREVFWQKCVKCLGRVAQLKACIANHWSIKLVESKSDTDSNSDSKVDKEKKRIIKSLSDTVVKENPNITWEDVAGLEDAKEYLKEALIFPLKFPNLFTGQRQPWKSILLFGPSGTGKSYLAKAVATKANRSTFFSVSSSSLVSPLFGESEKTMKTLFELASTCRPSIIFMEDIDSFAFPSEKESETTRRLKAEFSIQMQNLNSDNDGVFVLGTTSAPWLLDAALKNTFEQTIYTPLPNEDARSSMFKSLLTTTQHSLTEREFTKLGQLSDGYSGADISVVVKDAMMNPLRKVQSATHFRRVSGECPHNKGVIIQDMLQPCAPGASGAIKMSWTNVLGAKLKEPVIALDDMLQSLQIHKPALNETDLDEYASFVDDWAVSID